MSPNVAIYVYVVLCNSKRKQEVATDPMLQYDTYDGFIYFTGLSLL